MSCRKRSRHLISSQESDDACTAYMELIALVHMDIHNCFFVYVCISNFFVFQNSCVGGFVVGMASVIADVKNKSDRYSDVIFI